MTSTVSNIPLWGRAWSISVTDQSGKPSVYTSSAWDPEALRATFEITTHCFHPVWTAKVVIWNLDQNNTPTIQDQYAGSGAAVGSMGSQITISAGYQAGIAPGQTLPVIFTGRIYQSLVERDEVVDLKTTWMCSSGLIEMFRSYTKISLAGDTSQQQVLHEMVARSNNPSIPFQISDPDKASLASVKTVRGNAFSGSLAEGFGQVARQMTNTTQTPWAVWFDGVHYNVGSIKNQKAAPDFTYSPIPAPSQNVTLDPKISYSLVGSPQQTQNGVEFRVLLDPRLAATTPQQLVKLDNTIIRKLEVLQNSLGGTNVPPYQLTKDNQYLVIGVQHIGDTRSNEWWTVVTGASTTLTAIQQIGPF